MKIRDKNSNVLSTKEVINKVINRIFNVFLDFWLMILRWVGFIPFHFVRKFFYRLSGIKIGNKATIHMWANFFKPRNISIGEGSIIGDHSFLDGRAPLIIGKHVDIASYVMIYNSEHDINSKDFSSKEEKVEISDNVFIGPRAIILPGVKIGKGAIVAAGAVVTKNVDDFKVVAGVPAVEISERKLKDLNYRLGRPRLFQ
ncbi:acyltransferase [Patescibacteria group bacterium]